MIPLESPVPEIGPPGSESGGRKRAHANRTAARLRKHRMSHQNLPATRLLSTRQWPEKIASVGSELVMHTAEGRSIRVLMSLGITAGLAGFVAYYPTTSLGQETRPNPTVKSIMTDAAIARIAAESRGIIREPPIEAAPRFSETLAGGDRTGRESRPSPPNGYSFVSYHGEMLRARIEGEGAVGEERLGTDLDWLGSTTSIETLAAHAAAAGRDWSFGWIRLAEDADPNDFARSLQGSGAQIVGSAGSLMRARLPGDETLLQQIAALPEIDGLGAVPQERKTRRGV